MTINYMIKSATKVRAMAIAFVACWLMSFSANAQNVNVTGGTTAAGSYADFATAIAAVNAAPATGAIIVTINAGHSETAPPTGFVVGSATLNPTLSSTNTLTINKTGGTVTLNAGVGTATPSSAAPDGIISIRGADYVTIDGLTLTDGNSASNTVAMEFGIGLFKSAAGDGCNNNTIQNCVINMQRVNNSAGSGPAFDGSVGIHVYNSIATAATTALTPTNGGTLATNGTNSGNRFYTNTINGGNIGIGFGGYAATAGVGPTPTATTFLGDLGNDVGGTSSGTGNIILNFGGGAATSPAAGIRANNQWSMNIQYNNVNNNNGSGVNHATTLRGIYGQAGTSANVTISNNTVSVKSAATTSALTGIENSIGSTAASNTVTISNNIIQNCTYATATTGTFSGILAAATATNQNVNNNQVINNTVGTAATASTCIFQGIYASSSSTNFTANSNTVSGNICANNFATMYCIRASTSTLIYNGNTISNNTIPNSTGASSSTLYGFYDGSSPVTETYTNNNINNLSISGASTATSHAIAGIYNLTASGVKTISGNNINNLSFSSSSTGYSTVIGIRNAYASTSNVFNNVVHALSSTGATPTVHGISIGTSTGTTYNVYNNLVGNLTAPQSAGHNLVGIFCGSVGTTYNISFNTVYLNATSSVTGSASSALFMSSTTPSVVLRDNILVNLSTGTTSWLSTAIRRTSTTLTSYGASSNYNLVYCGTPSAMNAIYYDGTNTDQTLAAFKARVASRESASVTEAVSSTPGVFFQSLTGPATGTSTTFLHLVNGLSTQAESGGIPVAGITDDYDGNTRNVSNPDIGADEFSGVAVDANAPTVTNISVFGNACSLVSRTVTADISDASGVATGGFAPRAYFRKNAGAYASVAGTLTSGTTSSGTWSFILTYSSLGGVTGGEFIDYFVVAQDINGNAGGTPSGGLVLSDVNTVTTPPTAPLTFLVQTALSGSFTVGAGGNYPTLTAAVSAYNISCLTGPVTFTLIDLSYGGSETFPITINMNADASATNTLTIKPQTTGTVISGTSTSGLIVLNGASYVTIDGSISATANTVCPASAASRDLTITNTSTGTASAVIWMQNVASNNTIKNCNIRGNGNTQTLFGIGNGSTTISITSVGGGSNNSIINNNISKTQYGIYSQGLSAANKSVGNIINQNLINTVSPDNVRTGGIITGFENNLTISGNNIGGLSYTSSIDGLAISVGYGVAIVYTTLTGNEVTNATITNNIINGVVNTSTTGYSAIGIAVASAASGTTLISNNMISGVVSYATPDDICAGIFVGGGTSTTNIYYNTVSMTGARSSGASGGTTPSYALLIAGTIPIVDIRNNILLNSQTSGNVTPGKSFAIGLAYTSTVGNYANLTSNNNDLFVSGAQGVLAKVGGIPQGAGTELATLAAWQTETGRDGASKNVLPVFISASDLHLDATNGTNISNIDGYGTPVSVLNDIDCTTRNASTPDIGADEFAVIGCTTAIGGSATGNASFCGSGTPTITASGYSIGTGSGYQWYFSTNIGDYPNAGSAVGGQTNPASLTTGVVSTTTYYWLSVTCGTNSSTDNSNMITVTVNPVAVASISGPASKCANDPAVTLTETGGNATSWSWSPGGATTQSINVNPGSTTTYTVTVTSPGPCTAVANKTLTVYANPTGVTATAPPAVCSGQPFNLSSTSDPQPLTVFNEGFESGAPGWAFEDSSSTGTTLAQQLFHIQASPYTDATGSATFNNFALTGSNFVYSNPDAGGSGSQTRTNLVSPTFSTVGFSGSSTLTFRNAYRFWSSSSPVEAVQVQISTDGGTTYTTLTDYSGTSQGTVTNGAQTAANSTVTVPAIYNGFPNVKIRFRFRSNWGYYWIMDDIALNATAAPTFAWTSSPAGFTSSQQNPTGVTQTANTDYTVTVTGAGGCTSTASTGIVSTNTAPVIGACPSNIVQCDNYIATWIDPTATGTPTPSVTCSPASGSTFSAGQTVVTCTAINSCDISSCTFTVTINETPVISACPPDITQCDNHTVTYIDPTATGTPSASVQCFPNSGSSFPTGTSTVTCTATNSCGTSSCSFSVTINESPDIAPCPGPYTQCDNHVVSFPTPPASGFPAATVVCSPASGSTFPAGTSTVTCTATNSCGNDFCAFSVTINETPQIGACPDDIDLCNTNVATWTDPTSTPGTPAGTVSCSPPSGSTFPTGVTTVTCTANNPCGSTSCTFDVTVSNITCQNGGTVNQFCGCDCPAGYSGQFCEIQNCVPPVIGACPSNITQCDNYTATWIDPTSTGTTPVVTCSPASGSTFSAGTTSVTCTATNGCGTSSCSFSVTINESPVIGACPLNITQCDNNVATWTNPSSTGTPAASVICSPASGSTFNTGTTTVTCVASNSCGASTCTFSVTINESPVLSPCPSDIVQCNNPIATWSDPVASGTPAATVVCSPASGSTFNTGTTTVTCSATNSCGTNSCTFSVTINESPVIGACPLDITQCDNNIATWTNPSSTGTPAASVICSPASGSTFNTGTTTVTCVATNSCGASTCTFSVTINETPVMSPCPSNIVQCNNPIATWSDPVASGTPSATVVCTPASGSTFNTGTTTVTCSATNSCGTASCTFSVTINESPVIGACPSDITTANPVVNYPTPSATGTPSPTVTCAPASGSTFAAGTTVVTCTATNSCGNSTCTFNVTVTGGCDPSTDPTSASSNAPYNQICLGGNVTLNVSGGSLGTNATWEWYEGGCGTGGSIGTGASITIMPATNGAHVYYVRAEGDCGITNCVSVTVNVTSAPPAGTVHYTASITDGCVGSPASTFSVNAVSGATFYRWTSAQAGVRFNGNPGPFETTVPNVNVTFVSLPASGSSGWSICVFAGNACGNSNSICTWVRATVSMPGAISGSVIGCPGSSGNNYSVPAVTGAVSYQWSGTNGMTITNNGSQNVQVTFPIGFTTGVLSVHGQTACGYNGPNRTLTINSTPAMPGTITGSSYPCPNGTAAYSIAPVSGAVSYTWSTSVPGAIVTGTTTTASIQFPGTIPAGSTVSVVANSSCPTSSAVRSKGIASGLPSVPVAINGPASGQCGQTGVSYSVTPVALATSYAWNTTCGTIVGPNNLSAISIDWPASFTSCVVTVSAVNACGTGGARSLTVSAVPATPPAISGNAAPCAGSMEAYSTAGSAGATSYTWTIPAGAIFIGPATGNNVFVQWGSTSGSVTVKANNACGSSAVRSLPCVISCRLAQMNAANGLNAVLYPNPVTDKATVKFNATDAGSYTLKLYDLIGQSMLSIDGSAVQGENMVELNLASIAKGVYTLSVISNGSTEQIRVVVE